VSDLVREKGEHAAKEPWHGEHPLFRLWLLCAVVNSLYSFWWDVTNDWGFDLLVPSTSPPPKRPTSLPRPLVLPSMHERDETLTGPSPIHSPAPSSSSLSSPTPQSAPHPWGLRSTLLFPLPLYPAAIFADLVLRLTWAVKLSSHLHAHAAAEGSLLIFVLEVAEIFRRWLWVFFRVEWEVVRARASFAHVPAYDGDVEELEMLSSTSSGLANGNGLKLHG